MKRKCQVAIFQSLIISLTILLLAASIAASAVPTQQEKKPPVSTILIKTLEDKGVDAAIAKYHEIKQTEADKYDFGPTQLMFVARYLMRNKNYTDAIRILEVDVEVFPENDLVIAYLGYSNLLHALSTEGGDTSRAEELYQKALTLNPDSSIAKNGMRLIYVVNNYTKKAFYIPMRDGIKLYTQAYFPNDTSKTYPILINRRPYGIHRYGEGKDTYRGVPGPSDLLTHEGYIFVEQDVRGTYMSEGEFEHVRPIKTVKSGPTDFDETTDTYDTIDWLLHNIPNNNGKVGVWGTSYMGYYSVIALIDSHPALAASAPGAPVADWFLGDDPHRNGAFYYLEGLSFFNTEGYNRPKPTQEIFPGFIQQPIDDVYEFLLEVGPVSNIDARYFKGQNLFWSQIMEHGTYDDFWRERSTLPHLHGIKGPVLNIGGWFDAEDFFGTLNTYKFIEKNNPGIVNTLVIGPWYHGGWSDEQGEWLGDVKLNAGSAAAYFREKVELPFFNHCLKGAADPNLPEALVFETGTNVWREYDQWPPKQSTVENLYLRADGKISFAPPSESADNSYDEYVSDPADPVPFMGETVSEWTYEWTHADQRFAAARPDVLVYQTDVLENDVTIAGPMTAELFVSTSGTDSDWIVKLIDVYPDDAPDDSPNEGVKMGGYQMLVRGDIMRGKFRNSFEKPQPFVPGEITRVAFEMLDINHTFRKGHRIMVQVQSTWFPLYDRNPQQFLDIYTAKPEDFIKATQRIYRSKDHPSHIVVNVVPTGIH
jgi:putative CocE/NonD family hydrolase